MIHQSRADNSTERVLRGLLAPNLLIIDDFGLKRLHAQQSSDFNEVIIERHRRTSKIVTSNRAIEEWIPLFDDPILAQSALDRLGSPIQKLFESVSSPVRSCGLPEFGELGPTEISRR